MPILGELKSAQKIGKKGKGLYVWVACPDCGKEKWFQKTYFNKSATRLCIYCANKRRRGEKNPTWKGGHCKTKEGYILLYINPENPYHPMARKNTIKEHRLVMAKSLGRCLASSEHVHHKNGIRDDNRLDNLELISLANHTMKTTFCNQCELRKEIRLLRWELKQMRQAIQGTLV